MAARFRMMSVFMAGALAPVLALTLGLTLSGCAGMAQVRGVGLNRGGPDPLISNALPAVAVMPAQLFSLADSGKANAPVSTDGMFASGSTAEAWYALYAGMSTSGKTVCQLVVMLADAPSRAEWPMNPLYTERRGLPMLREGDASRPGVPMTGYVYVRPARLDPWMPVYDLTDQGWVGDVLVSQHVWWAAANRTKVVVEYREPVPKGGVDIFPFQGYEDVAGFMRRAEAAFSVLRPELDGQIYMDIGPVGQARPDSRLLANVLGEVWVPLKMPWWD